MITLQQNCKFTKTEFEKLSVDQRQKYPFYCPDEFPYFCGRNSSSFGLCKKSLEDCEKVEKEGVIPIIATNYNNTGLQFGYHTENLHKRCNYLVLNRHQEFPNINFEIPMILSIMTYNIWGMFSKNEFERNLLKKRLCMIANIVIQNNPDIICFQEMSIYSFIFLKYKLSHLYKYQYEKNYEMSWNINRHRKVETIIFSKFPVMNYQVYSLEGNLNYSNSFIRAEFNDIVLYNVYLQAGSKYSPGQELFWFHYTRCRIDQLKKIKELIDKETKPVICCGDFNFHLDGGKDWLEYKEIQNYFKDSFREISNAEGFTENTEINTMRWNVKFQEKKVRYDGILYKENSLKPFYSKLVGKNYYALDEKSSKKFKDCFGKGKENLIKTNADKIHIFPSDHFGVLTKFFFQKYLK